MYEIYLKHKNENFFSLVVNGSYSKYIKWMRKNSNKYKKSEVFEIEENSTYFEE